MNIEIGFRPASKLWLEKNGTAFGEGLYNLLYLVEKTGSISAAALEMGMSYRTAWGKIRAIEKAWGVRLVDTRVGGKAGGGSGITQEAYLIMDRLREFRQQVEDVEGMFIG
ncbi:MAG: winged helix-turn-helix domain-containing protein [Bacillota bacterium]